MRSRLPALILGSIITLLSGGGFAQADTSVRTRTPVPTASATSAASPSHPPRPSRAGQTAPPAGDLLLRMRSAMVKQGSVHVDFHMVSALYPVGEATTHLRGDVSWKFNLLHDRTTVQRTDSGHANAAPLESIDLRLVHQRAASHNRVGGWQCQNLAHIQVMSTLLGLEETVLSARVVAAGVVNGTLVWEVSATGYSPATGSGIVAHVVYDISQTDTTLQRVQVTGTSSFGGRTQQIVASEAYTHYGETVNVQLPAVCSLR
jgi:hypothetical protein